MAFTLQIKKKGMFGSKSIDFGELVSRCGLRYGSVNEFYILEEGKVNNNTAVLYNPKRIGRGIFFDGRKVDVGEITLSYNIPTTPSEIRDFVLIAKEIERQFKKVEMYCEEEKTVYTTKTLEENVERMIQFSLESLHSFCKREEYSAYIFTLAMYPWTMTKEKLAQYISCNNLLDFEQTIHDLQSIDAYYAKPTLLKNKNDGRIVAAYTLTEECLSIFPIKAEGFLNLDNIKVDEGIVRFFIFSEKRVLDEVCSYEKFISYWQKYGAEQFDEEHLLIPAVTKERMLGMIEEIL